jgi:hypothetical protein
MLKIRITGQIALLEHLKDELGKEQLKVYKDRSDCRIGNIYINANSLESVQFIEAMKSSMARDYRR